MTARSFSILTTIVSALGCACSQPASVPISATTSQPTDESQSFSLVVLERGREASPASVEALIDSLDKGDVSERRDSAFALGIAAMMGAEHEAIESAAIARLKSEDSASVVAALLWALGRAGKARSVAALADYVGDSRVVVASAAALALGVMGRRQVALDDTARLALVTASSRPTPSLVYAVTYALAREHEAPVDPAALRTLESLAMAKQPEVRATALTGLGRRQRGAERLIVGLADDDWRVAVEAIRGLFAVKGAANVRAVSTWLRAAIADKKLIPHPTRVALEGLAEATHEVEGVSAAGSLVGRQLPSSPSMDDGQFLCLARAVQQRRWNDLPSLRGCGGSAVPTWWRAQVVARAVAASSHLDGHARTAPLIALASDADPRARAAAITALADLGSGPERPAVLALFASALADKSVAVAGSAADGVASLGLRGPEGDAINTAIAQRAMVELGENGELGLTLVNAIAKNRIESGRDACRSAAVHANRTIRRAGLDCFEAFGLAPIEAPPLVRAPPPTPEPGVPVLWRVKTTRGILDIRLLPKIAPRHVAAVIKLTNERFYDGLLFHRVVPNFVIQGGDPDGTGWGGPDFVIPAEPSPLPFDRGAVGIADAGPDTGGSQWFVMHSRAPHLEGRYTRIGTVVSGMEAVDAIAVGDRIISARIVDR